MTTTFISDVHAAQSAGAKVWTGRVLSGIAVLFLTMDAVIHLLQPRFAVEGTTQLGFPAGVLLPLGIIQIVALILYVVPRTSILGAILWTGYLGGAVAAHVRIGNPLFTHVLSPVYVAALLWLGLALRDARVAAVLKREGGERVPE